MKTTIKATGVVRRIDDLGRIVIPKEIRRTLHIKEGDPLEIFRKSPEYRGPAGIPYFPVSCPPCPCGDVDGGGIQP